MKKDIEKSNIKKVDGNDAWRLRSFIISDKVVHEEDMTN